MKNKIIDSHILRVIMRDLKIAKEELLNDGGDGSGNFGHKGRPGKVGGSSESESTNNPANARKYGAERIDRREDLAKLSPNVKRQYLNTIKHEKKITTDIENLNKKLGMAMIGEKFAIKQPGSYARKIRDIMAEKNVSEEQAPDYVHDAIRYTSVTSAKNLVPKAIKMLKTMQEQGYQIKEIKNSWNNPDNPYKGINIKVVDPNGAKFELQFHTAQSFDMKERKQHKSYEEWRLPTTSEDRKRELTKIMFDKISNSPKWNVPKGIEQFTYENIFGK